MPYYTPLRYPGGKRRLIDVVAGLLKTNGLSDIEYVEPYAGGGAVAMAMLLEHYASTIHINDLSRPVFAFWNSVLNRTDWLCKRIERTSVTMREWKRQRAVYQSRDSADLDELGFATLFLNRTNRSGIIGGGVIGGKAQAGEWSLDVRFYKPEIIKRVRAIGRQASRIKLYQMDALEFTKQVIPSLGRRAFIFFDPPYIENGQDLYLNDYSVDDHKKLATRIMRLRQPWIVTYDRAAVRNGLYEPCRRVVYDMKYTTQARYLGREVMFVSDGLKLPPIPQLLGPRMHLVRHQTKVS